MVAEGEFEFADQKGGSEGRELSAEGDDLSFDFGGCFARLSMRSTGVFQQARGPVLLIATQPFAYGGDGGPPGSSPFRRVAISSCRFGLMHFNFTRGIRCE